MIIKSIGYTVTGLTFASLISDTFYNKLDRNLVTPVRNFMEVLHDIDSFVMPEDFKKFR
jgi:hypothetical protein